VLRRPSLGAYQDLQQAHIGRSVLPKIGSGHLSRSVKDTGMVLNQPFQPIAFSKFPRYHPESPHHVACGFLIALTKSQEISYLVWVSHRIFPRQQEGRDRCSRGQEVGHGVAADKAPRASNKNLHFLSEPWLVAVLQVAPHPYRISLSSRASSP
jgi:hypothetical protein